MTGREMIARILDHPEALDAEVDVVDQFGATQSPVVDIRIYDGQLILDIAVPES